MILSSGTRLGSYEVLAPIGKGGMGEVWKARDTKLGRDVALKILPAAFASDPDRMARFEREARVLASLDHPNIAAIYGLEESDGVRALVLALVDGPTLADRIAAGPIPLEEAIQIARQIAEAVEYAHERGVIHRDLKPANIKLTSGGMVKVLDFGLAKALDDEPAAGSGTNSPTLTMGATKAGVLLGTAQYMSPEQAKGKQADRRSDIWSFGAVLYEMVSGKPPFSGETVGDTLASVIKDEPKLDGVPIEIRGLVARCLNKDPRKRLQAIGEARIILEEPATPAPFAVAPKRTAHPLWWAVTVIAVLCASVLGFIHFREKPPEARLLRTSILPPDKTVLGFTSNFGVAALSPDGRRLVFAATGTDGKSQLWIRPLDAQFAQSLPGTEGATFPFWSPDSKFVAFFAGGKLKKIDISGGPALTLADAPAGRGGSWNAAGVIVFAPINGGQLQRVSAEGGASSPASWVDATRGVNARFPWFLPDGKHFLFVAEKRPTATRRLIMHVGSLDSQESKVLGDADSNAIYSQGHLLFLRENTLMAQPFDLQRLIFTAEAVPVAEQVQHVLNPGSDGCFSASSNGLLVFQPGLTTTGLKLTWFDRSGKTEGMIGEAALFNNFHFSPDRKSLAAAQIDSQVANTDIWIYEMARGLPTRFTFDPALDTSPVWSADGHSVIFCSNRRGHYDLYQKAANGSGTEELLYADNLDKYPTSWSPDGKFLLYYANDAKTNNDIWVLPLTGAGKPYPFLKTSFSELFGQFSPDGRWIAYQSNESQRNEIYVAPFPGPGGKRQISTAGGTRPRWRDDGKEIFYIGLDLRLMTADVVVRADTVEVGATHPLFGPLFGGGGYTYDVSADGQHILVAASPEQKFEEPLTLVENWTTALKK